MKQGDLRDRAKAIGEALLAERTVSILERARNDQLKTLSPQEATIIEDGIALVISSKNGFLATQTTSSSSFMAFMASLDAFQTSFAAMMNARMLKTDEDIQKCLDKVEETLTKVGQSSRPSGFEEAINFFKSLSLVNSQKADTMALRRLQKKAPTAVG